MIEDDLSWKKTFDERQHFEVREHLFPNSEIEILDDFRQIPEFSKNSKARALMFWILALYISMQALVKTEFKNQLKWSMVGGMINTPPPSP